MVEGGKIGKLESPKNFFLLRVEEMGAEMERYYNYFSKHKFVFLKDSVMSL